jgi:ATP-dependent RNA/DNA helicase IGHMBP2
MPLLHLDALPPRTTKGTIVRLLTQIGEIDRAKIGAIEIGGRGATVEVPDDWAARLVKSLDGASLGNRHIRARVDGGRAPGAGEDHFQRLIRLLEMEAKAEAKQALQRIQRLSPAEAEQSGNSLVGLVIRDVYSGLGGRTLITFSKRDVSRPLPWTRLSAGSPVLLSEESVAGGHGWRGVVCEKTSSSLQVAFAQMPQSDRERPTFRLDAASDEIGRQRQRQALERAETAQRDRLAELRDVLLGSRPPSFSADAACEPLDASLNESQQQAVSFALSADDVAIIHGPPGTGKTTTVVELIRQAVRREQKVLACAPSNLAVDNMFERLLARGERAVRLGHPARVLPELREHTLDMLVDAHPDVRVARKLVRDAYSLRDKAAKWTRAKPLPGAKREMREEANLLLADARRLEAQVVQQILDSATVLCATLTSLDSEILGQRRFDLVVIDEACQSTEPACWIPLLRSHRVVLAGDHCQLPPTVVSYEAEREGFGVSLLERLLELHGPQISRRLIVQYRMHQSIMEFSSAQFYESTLVADAAVASHLLCELPNVATNELTQSPVHFIDTAGADYDEQLEPDGESRLNPHEAQLVVRKVQALIDSGVAPADIAVIAPYAAQVRLLRERLKHSGLEIDTVDGFQGREKEAVVISLVRSNREGQIGFLGDVRRMNVALTRARRKLIVIGDSATIGGHPFYQRLLEYFETLGAYHTVWEEV